MTEDRRNSIRWR